MNNIKVGITGGIGSGKSTIAKFFKNILQIPVYLADDRAKFLVNNDKNIKTAIVKEFGEMAYLNNVYNASFIASVVFTDNKKLQKLNQIIHPIVKQDYLNWLETHKNAPYTIKEAAILIESGSYKDLDFVILVSADNQLKISRVTQRDNTTENEVLARINKQMPDEEKRKYIHAEIVNNKNSMVIPQILSIHQQLLSL